MNSNDPRRAHSIISSFQRLYERDPGQTLFTFIDEKGRDQEPLTVGELAEAAGGIAQSLRSWGLAAGDRAMLVYPPSLDFVKAFLGCMAAGVIPVPVCPPYSVKLKQDIAAFSAFAASSGARVVLTNSAYERARTMSAATGFSGRGAVRWPDLPWHQTDRHTNAWATPTTWHMPASAGEPAFLQYTSGSTGIPKGVVITHGNLRHEMEANLRDFGMGAGIRSVFWLPHYHDLGLINVILNTIVGNSPITYLMSPLTFLKRPETWFEVISRVRATHTAAPNFAYDLVVRKTTPEMRRSWDLSSLQMVASAGEQVRPATVRAFLDAFTEAKLPPEAFYSGYGLAECSVSVSIGGRTELKLDKRELEAGRAVPLAEGSDRPGLSYFSCGRVTKEESSVRIVDPDTCRPCLPGQIGEIWVDSPTKATGYWGLPEESEEVFRAKVVGEDSSREYLRTGDRGFFFNGELFVTGRHKDLIIIRGHNLYPQDIEDSVRGSHPLIRPGGIAAFSVPAGNADSAGEQLVLFVEIRVAQPSPAEHEEILRTVRRRVNEDYQIPCHAVVLGTAGMVEKTTSGKIRRRACRQAFVSGEIHGAETTIGVFLRPGTDPRLREPAR